MTGTIFDIKRFAIHDGPGIRTTVFLKGCPLKCWWCHNPESQFAGHELLYHPVACLRCGWCVAACSAGALSLDESGVKRDAAACTLCGQCAEACPSEALTMIGRQVATETLIQEVVRDSVFFEESGGGVTFSGGEPLAQSEFLVEMLDRCGEHGIHRAVDTSGYATQEVLMNVATRTDLFLFDLKLMSEELHRKYTGTSNVNILENIKALSATGKEIEIRIPAVPMIINEDGNIASVGEFLSSLQRRPRVRLLPYHRTAMHKYERIDMEQRLSDVGEPSTEDMEKLAESLKAYELEVACE